MCGICGVVQVRGEPRPVLERDVLDRMTDAMLRRGPDDRGTYEADGVAIGVRRLSIVDVEGGHQPFANEDGTVWAAQNGELYNHDALRRELERDGHAFRSRCDTEVLPHLYERDGDAVPERLRGKFGLVVWDGRRRRALLARDRLGVKPLYWAPAGDLLVFASELKSLLASGLVSTELDHEALAAYLELGYVPAPLTPLAGVAKLLPGHRLVVEDGRIRAEPYWRFPRPAPETGRTEAEWAEELEACLDEAVRLRLMSDVPLGAMLSGGLDSSLVVALMARHSTAPVKTFSVGFVESGEANELDDARLVATAFGAEHHELELSIADREVDLATLAWCLDEPVADLSAVGFLALSELAARHVKVALSGQGADELFGGYLKHQAASIRGALPGPLAVVLGRAGAHGPRALRRAARTLAAPDAATRLLAMSGKLTGSRRGALLRGPLAAVEGSAALRLVQERARGLSGDPLAETLYLDAQLALPDDMLHYFDRASMWHSLEVRVPFLDHELVELCARIPSGLKVRRLRTKHLLKRVARGIVPDRAIDKPKVGFFRDSVDLWFDRQLRGAVSDWLLDGELRCGELVDSAAVRALVEDHVSGRNRSNSQLLLSILMLEVWLAAYVPHAAAAACPSPVAS